MSLNITPLQLLPCRFSFIYSASSSSRDSSWKNKRVREKQRKLELEPANCASYSGHICRLHQCILLATGTTWERVYRFIVSIKYEVSSITTKTTNHFICYCMRICYCLTSAFLCCALCEERVICLRSIIYKCVGDFISEEIGVQVKSFIITGEN